jgi:hypothetical protein
MGYLRDWNGYKEALLKIGLILPDLEFVAGWSRELKAMNERKEGARYYYPNYSSSCWLSCTLMFYLIGSWKASCAG